MCTDNARLVHVLIDNTVIMSCMTSLDNEKERGPTSVLFGYAVAKNKAYAKIRHDVMHTATEISQC